MASSAKCASSAFDDEAGMQMEGSNTYSTAESPKPADKGLIRQGMLESSNVEPVVEISHMIEVMRAYQRPRTLPNPSKIS